MSQDGAPIEFTIPEERTKGTEKKKPRPPRPPPPSKRNSKSAMEYQNGNDTVDGSRHRTLSSCDSGGPPDSIQCMCFAYTFTKKNGKL